MPHYRAGTCNADIYIKRISVFNWSRAFPSGLQTMGGLIGSVGVMLFALGLSTRSEFNKIFSLVIAILFGISAITSVIAMNDTSSWEIISAYWGLTYIAISAYSIHLGLVIRKK